MKSPLSCFPQLAWLACSLLASSLCLKAQAPPVPQLTEQEALNIFKPLRFYGDQWLPQDMDASALKGVHTPNSSNADLRSETLYPPFILSPRRQTDGMVRQLYSLLPASITDTTAFVVGDRFAQNPEAYLPYLRSRQDIAIAGSFMGIGQTATQSLYNTSWAKGEHDRELSQLEGILALAGALNKNVVSVTYAMGDSSGAIGGAVRIQVQARMNALLAQYGHANLQGTVSWGADETVAMSMAKLLPSKTVKIRYANPNATQHYDSQNTAQTITNDKLSSLGLVATSGSTFDFEVAVFTRKVGGANNNYLANDSGQAALDNTFASNFTGYSAAQRSKLAIVDGRMFNGAWDSKSLITNNTDYLAFGGWGTFGNKLGQTLAVAKIVLNNAAARKQLYLEAVAHDVFMNGYAEAQRGALFARLNNVTTNWGHWSGWTTEKNTNDSFWVINDQVNLRMNAFYGAKLGTGTSQKKFKITPQMWRVFEAEIKMTPADVVLPVGVYRTAPSFMNPQNGIFPQLTMSQLIPPPITVTAPTGLTVTNTTSHSIGLSWTDVATNETAYKVQRSTAVDGPFIDLITNLDPNTEDYIDIGLLAGTTYYYRVFALNGSDSSSSADVNGVTGKVTISGNITSGGTPLAGVVVSDGTRSATTASDGSYSISGVSVGIYTLTPALATHTFAPGSKTVAVFGTSLSNQNFVATPANLTPVITSALTANGITTNAFTYSIVADNSPTSYGATGLPSGLTLNSSTGTITGIPTSPGSSNVTISATNSGGTGSATLVISVILQSGPPPQLTEQEALDLFVPLRFYQLQWLPQDMDGTTVLGVHTPSSSGADLRSEALYPPFILSPRRQTDSMVRQLYALLPKSLTDTTAFAVGDRFAQNPTAYLPYLKSRQNFAIAGSFMGIGTIGTQAVYDTSWARLQHDRELSQLEGMLALAGALGKNVVGVTYAMGDSSGAVGGAVRTQMEARMNALLVRYGHANLQGTLSWGADETVAMSMAKLLPNMTVRIQYSNPLAPQHYDSQNTAQQITNDKLQSIGLTATTGSIFDIDLAVFTRRVGGINFDYQSNDTLQAALDNSFAANFTGYNAAQRSKLAIVDGRLFNGAWDTKSLLTNNTDYLAYGAWGTFGNKLGSTLAVAKIVLNNAAARKQLFLEAVAHDAFMGGYAEAQRGVLFTRLRTLTTNWGHWSGWTTEQNTNDSFWVINDQVNIRMNQFYGANIAGKSFRFSPQMWRIFEADVRMTPAEVVLPVGVFRTEPPFMNPRNGVFPQMTLSQITTLPPTGVAISSTTSNSLSLSWTDVASNETAYKIQRATAAGGPFVDVVSNLAPDTTAYTDSGLLSGTTYYYLVSAMNGSTIYPSAVTSGATTAVIINEPVITSALEASGATDNAFTYSITASNSPTSYGAIGLPTGLTLDYSTGEITGIPTSSGISNVTISATNSGGTGSGTLVISVTLQTYSIYGLVTNNGNPLAGVTISNGTTTASTDATGVYHLENVEPGSYTLVPGLAGYQFTPNTLSVTVNAANITGLDFTGLTEQQSWYAANNVPTDGTGAGAADADPDGDGISNLLEYALGGDLTSDNAGIIPVAEMAGERMELSFVRLRDDVIYQVEASDDFINWYVIPTVPVALGEVQTVRDTEDNLQKSERFIRLRVTKP